MATMADYLAAAGIKVSDADHRDRVLQDFDLIRILGHRNRMIGMVKLVKDADVWKLVQIQILPEFQRLGFATQLISSILADAGRSSVRVELSVLKINPARSLYERLGFETFAEDDHSYRMENRAKRIDSPPIES